MKTVLANKNYEYFTCFPISQLNLNITVDLEKNKCFYCVNLETKKTLLETQGKQDVCEC